MPSTSGRKLAKIVTGRTESELSQDIKDVLNKGTIEDILQILQKVGAFQKELEKEGKFAESTQNRLWSWQMSLHFQILKLTQDSLAVIHKESGDGEVEIVEIMKNSFEVLVYFTKRLASNEGNGKKVSEIYARLCCFSSQMSFRTSKIKQHEEALEWCEAALNSCALCVSSEIFELEMKWDPKWMILQKAECLRVLSRPEEGLRWLAKQFANDPKHWEQPAVCHDIFEQIPWTEIGTHWVHLYKDVWTFKPEFNQTSLDFLEEDDSIFLDQKTTSKVLRLELNSHFSTRCCVPSGLVAVGGALIERSFCQLDNVLGYLGVAVGNSLGSPDQVDFAVEMIHEAVEFIETDPFFELERNSDATAFISGLISIWRGICILKKQQFFVEAEMDIMKAQVMSENPEKYKDRDTGEELRGVSGLSLLNLDHESDWVCSLSHGIEIFFRFAESEEVLKSFSNEYCPSMVLTSCRFAACLLTAVGDVVNGIKAWHVVNKLAKIYDKKGLIVLSASEILKVVPDLECEAVILADKVNTTARKENLIKHNRAISYRLSLAKAIACYKLKLYAEGVTHLLKTFEYLSTKENFDASHHLMGEATYVLSWYRTIQFSHEIDLSGFPESLVKMSPAGLATRAFKLLSAMTRDPDIVESGWTDIAHNYFLLSAIFDVGHYSVRVLKDSGKTRELKCFLSDFVHFSQHCGFVTRSLSVIVPMITLDIETRNFLQAQIKIDAVHQVLINSKCSEEKEDGDAKLYKETIENMKLSPLTLERLECMNDLKWVLQTLEIPSFCYRNRSNKVIEATRKDLRNGFGKTEFSFPPWMRHNLSCSCYVCCHPQILPTAYEFYHAHARYMNCMSKAKSAMALLETSKLSHERAIFRLMCNLSMIFAPLGVIASKQAALKAVERMYTPFCVNPGLNVLLAEMTICPVIDIKMILFAMKKAIVLLDYLDPKDYIAKAVPQEVAFSALYKYFINTKKINVKGSEIRQILESKLKTQEKENKLKGLSSPTPTEPKSITGLGAPPKKGILKVTSKRLMTKYDEIIEDPPIPICPILNFESEDLTEDSPRNASEENPKTRSQVSKPQAQKSNITERRTRRTAK